jgi:hypothetical protein
VLSPKLGIAFLPFPAQLVNLSLLNLRSRVNHLLEYSVGRILGVN